MMKYLNKNNLKVFDSFKRCKGVSPITYGEKDPETGMCENVLTYHLDLGSQQSLDYIFEVFYNENHNNTNSKVLYINFN